MFVNVSSTVVTHSASSSHHAISTRLPAPTQRQHYAGPIPAPVMYAIPDARSGRVGSPDRAGMRERRAHTEMSVAQLKRDRGVVRQQSPHEEILEAYGYRQLAQLVADLPALATHAFHALSTRLGDAMNVRLGPPVADAASTSVDSPVVDTFVRKFSADFEISLNSVARKATDMRGMIILIGEPHDDSAVLKPGMKILFEFDESRGDRFFTKNLQIENFMELSANYLSNIEDPDLLAEYREFNIWKYVAEIRELNRGEVDYLRKHAPLGKDGRPKLTLETIIESLRRYGIKLPVPQVPEFDTPGGHTQASDEHDNAWIANVLRKDRTVKGMNYVVASAAQLPGISAQLDDLPVLCAVPRSQIAPLSVHDEM